MLKERDIEILRTLARKYAEYASLPIQKEKKRMWIALNSGRMERPMVLVDQLPWVELDTDGSMRCQIEDPYWREVEDRLRKEIYKWEHCPADMVLDPYIALYIPTITTGWGVEIQDDQIEYEAGNDIVSHRYHNQFETFDDVQKIQMPTVKRDYEAEKLVRQHADRIFEGIIPYRMSGAMGEGYPYGFRGGHWDFITMWMGVTDLYYDFIEEPDLVHAIMGRVTDGVVGLIDQYNAQGLFDVETNYIHCSQTYCSEVPREGCDHEHAQSQDAWAFGMAQLMTSVSPSITDEFEVAYMQKTFSKMGAVYYGCCERLDDRLDIVAKMPNIRKVSCSPWSNREHFAEVLPDAYVMSNKPTPALLAETTFSLDKARADIRRTIAAAKRYDRRLEMILKDVSTLRHDPRRLWDWAKMAVEEAERSV